MIKCKLIDSDWTNIRTAFDAITFIQDECKIEIDQEKIRLKTMDDSHIAYINLELRETKFDIYECTTPTTITIDARQLIQVLKLGKNDDVMTWIIDENNLTVEFDGSMKKKFPIPLIDNTYEVPDLPEVDSPVKISIPSSNYTEAINNVNTFAEKLGLTVDTDYITFESFSDYGGDCSIKYLHGEKVDDEYRSFFTTQLLKNTSKAEKCAPKVQLEMGNNIPLTVTYEDYDLMLKFILAPRREDT